MGEDLNLSKNTRRSTRERPCAEQAPGQTHKVLGVWHFIVHNNTIAWRKLWFQWCSELGWKHPRYAVNLDERLYRNDIVFLRLNLICNKNKFSLNKIRLIQTNQRKAKKIAVVGTLSPTADKWKCMAIQEHYKQSTIAWMALQIRNCSDMVDENIRRMFLAMVDNTQRMFLTMARTAAQSPNRSALVNENIRRMFLTMVIKSSRRFRSIRQSSYLLLLFVRQRGTLWWKTAL